MTTRSSSNHDQAPESSSVVVPAGTLGVVAATAAAAGASVTGLDGPGGAGAAPAGGGGTSAGGAGGVAVVEVGDGAGDVGVVTAPGADVVGATEVEVPAVTSVVLEPPSCSWPPAGWAPRNPN